MATFSERYGYKPVRSALGQFESMDDGLRVAIWNYLYAYHLIPGHEPAYGRTNQTVRYFWAEFMKKPLDAFDSFTALVDIRYWYDNAAEWYEIYDVLEFFSSAHPERINDILAREGSAYRAVDGRIVPITSPEEIIAVEEAATASGRIQKAIELLASRQNPDVENIIKESMLAVEYAVKDATGEDVAKGLEKIAMHSQLAQAWKNMYHWASQEPGVRHAAPEQSQVGMAEARYVLVAASAFVNYLKSKGL